MARSTLRDQDVRYRKPSVVLFGALCRLYDSIGDTGISCRWYGFWDAEEDDADAFERRLDAVVREIGERCKLMLPEAVPLLREPTPGEFRFFQIMFPQLLYRFFQMV